jgi:hypothetical protein
MTESLIEHLDLKNVMVLTASAGMMFVFPNPQPVPVD